MGKNNPYNGGSDVIEVSIKDCSSRLIMRVKESCDNKKEVAKIFKLLSDKYSWGLSLSKIPMSEEEIFSSDEEMKWN